MGYPAVRLRPHTDFFLYFTAELYALLMKSKYEQNKKKKKLEFSGTAAA